MIYPLLLIAGFAGLVLMALMGFMHGAGHHGHGQDHALHHGHDAGHTHGHVDAGHGHAAAPSSHLHAGHTGHGHSGHSGHGGHGGDDGANADGDVDTGSDMGTALRGLVWVMPLLSPLNWFSWLLGAGAAGTLCIGLKVGEPWAASAAVVGAIAFKQGVVQPIWNTIFGFVSKPAANLDGCLMQQVEAITGFNERGEGLVRVTIDGRTEDVLARLTPDERMRGGERVRRGDQLLIEEVEPESNTCKVSRA